MLVTLWVSVELSCPYLSTAEKAETLQLLSNGEDELHAMELAN